MTAFPLTVLATVIALIVYIWVFMVAGRARTTYGVAAPAVTGHLEFEKRLRVQMNTLEQLVLFLPALWLAAPVLGDMIAAGIGAVWSLGRILYATAYYRDPKTRSLGFMLTFSPSAVLLVAAAWGAIRMLMA